MGKMRDFRDISVTGYVGAYTGMVKRARPILILGSGPFQARDIYVLGNVEFNQSFWSSVFAPVHQADLHIRREKWVVKQYRHRIKISKQSSNAEARE
jgi:hypothetical protein